MPTRVYISYYRRNNMSNTLTLNNAETGKIYRIEKCELLPDVRVRFAEMGLVPGTDVCILKKAPLGDPIEISVRGYSLCIRNTEAEHFIVKEPD